MDIKSKAKEVSKFNTMQRPSAPNRVTQSAGHNIEDDESIIIELNDSLDSVQELSPEMEEALLAEDEDDVLEKNSSLKMTADNKTKEKDFLKDLSSTKTAEVLDNLLSDLNNIPVESKDASTISTNKISDGNEQTTLKDNKSKDNTCEKSNNAKDLETSPKLENCEDSKLKSLDDSDIEITEETEDEIIEISEEEDNKEEDGKEANNLESLKSEVTNEIDNSFKEEIHSQKCPSITETTREVRHDENDIDQVSENNVHLPDSDDTASKELEKENEKQKISDLNEITSNSSYGNKEIKEHQQESEVIGNLEEKIEKKLLESTNITNDSMVIPIMEDEEQNIGMEQNQSEQKEEESVDIIKESVNSENDSDLMLMEEEDDGEISGIVSDTVKKLDNESDDNEKATEKSINTLNDSDIMLIEEDEEENLDIGTKKVETENLENGSDTRLMKEAEEENSDIANQTSKEAEVVEKDTENNETDIKDDDTLKKEEEDVNIEAEKSEMSKVFDDLKMDIDAEISNCEANNIDVDMKKNESENDEIILKKQNQCDDVEDMDKNTNIEKDLDNSDIVKNGNDIEIVEDEVEEILKTLNTSNNENEVRDVFEKIKKTNDNHIENGENGEITDIEKTITSAETEKQQNSNQDFDELKNDNLQNEGMNGDDDVIMEEDKPEIAVIAVNEKNEQNENKEICEKSKNDCNISLMEGVETEIIKIDDCKDSNKEEDKTDKPNNDIIFEKELKNTQQNQDEMSVGQVDEKEQEDNVQKDFEISEIRSEITNTELMNTNEKENFKIASSEATVSAEEQLSEDEKVVELKEQVIDEMSVHLTKSSDISPDLISDNAQDNHDGIKEIPSETANAEITIEADEDMDKSNSSSSSNLLEISTVQEARGQERRLLGNMDNDEDDDVDKEAENDFEEDDDNNVHIDGDESDSRLTPPLKRFKPSDENEKESDLSITEDNSNAENQLFAVGKKRTSKRLHISTEEDDISNSVVSKKLRSISDSIDNETKENQEGSSQENVDKNSAQKKEDNAENDNKLNIEDQKEEKLEDTSKEKIKDELPKDILYPPPKFDSKARPIRLDFLRRFQKHFENMTRHDLEEFVMQKIVETIVFKSEFSEANKLIEKHEKTEAIHRAKIFDLSKQLRDMKMVFNRLVKDLEAKNSQVVMPVKITRAVGLQVCMPKRNEPTLPCSTQLIAKSVSNTKPQTISSPEVPQTSVPMTIVNSTVVTNTTAALPTLQAPVRRGCVQKITPTRPVGGQISSTPVVYRHPPPLSQIPQQPNKNIPPIQNTTRAEIANVLKQRSGLQMRQILPTPNSTETLSSMAKGSTSSRRAEPSTFNAQATPITTIPANTPVMQNYMASLQQLNTGAISITPARTKEKDCIDLTEDDDATSSYMNSSSSSSKTVKAPHMPPAPLIGGNLVRQRYIMPNPTQFSHNIRMPPQILRLNNPIPSSAFNNTTNTSISSAKKSTGITFSTLSGSTSITRIPANNSKNYSNLTLTKSYHHPQSITTGFGKRKPSNNNNHSNNKFSQPPPLPTSAPPQLRTDWKKPPPSPSIRINNMDNGIIISWTMDDVDKNYAPCDSYQIYAYQDTGVMPQTDSWRFVGNVKAMLLPMAVTLTQFQEGHRYFFAVRAVDIHKRVGPFSQPRTWS